MRTFQTATLSEFQDLIDAYPFTRKITDIDLHHSKNPRQTAYRGSATIEAMWRNHTGKKGWEDIAQHVTIAPDGDIWLCRNFNWVPASARGFNGNRTAGPFMIVLIGDFDQGMDEMPIEQLNATLGVIHAVQRHFEMRANTVRFHRDMSAVSCPGSNMDKDEWIERIENYSPAVTRSLHDQPFPQRAGRYLELLDAMQPNARQRHEALDAEHDCGDSSNSRSVATDSQPRGLTNETLDRLSDHVINLERGRLSTSGRIETTQADIDRLFDEVLVSKIDIARAAGRKFHIVFYAHGGLVSEKNALMGALNQLDFWLDNGIYPIFFIWETGMAETIKQLVRGSADRASGQRDGQARGSLKDSAIEVLSRALGGDTIWGGMQSSAELASDSDGGANYVARKTGKLAKRFLSDVQVHTVGHSAGSIFHAHFMVELAAHKVKVRSAHFLAPAIRNDVFHQTLGPLLGNKIKHLTVFTMNKRREKRDSVAKIYGQSLLYLIYEALEREKKTLILGLEESLRGDKKTRQLFGLRGAQSDMAEIVFSPSDDTSGGSASNATTHGGFDEDRTTMESVLRRILNKRRGESIEAFPTNQHRAVDTFWENQFEWPEELVDTQYATSSTAHQGSAADRPQSTGNAAQSASGPSTNAASPPDVAIRPSNGDTPAGSNGSGRKVTALCIGINAYTESPLSGCVRDARLWATTLRSLGFEADLLLEEEATGDAIREGLTKLVRSSVPGDHLVFQFAGHGTQFEDSSGDESDDPGPALDECLCGIDCDSSDQGLVIDDEIRAILDTLPNGVAMTCFFDCCHSGSATRMFQRRATADGKNEDRRARFKEPTPFMQEAYQRRLSGVHQRSSRVAALRKEVLFSACRDIELAYETDGQGDFTRRAVDLLSNSVGRISNVEFLERVVASFGSQARQTPQIDCEFTERSKNLLGGDHGGDGLSNAHTPTRAPTPDSAGTTSNGIAAAADSPA